MGPFRNTALLNKKNNLANASLYHEDICNKKISESRTFASLKSDIK